MISIDRDKLVKFLDEMSRDFRDWEDKQAFGHVCALLNAIEIGLFDCIPGPPPATPEPEEREPVAWVWRSHDGFIHYNSCVKKPSEAEDRYIHGVHGGWCPVYW